MFSQTIRGCLVEDTCRDEGKGVWWMMMSEYGTITRALALAFTLTNYSSKCLYFNLN